MESRYRLACALASLTIWTVLACGTADAAELYGSDTNFTVNTLVKIDPATGSFQTIGPFNFNVQGLAYAPDLDQLYGLSAETRRVYRINRSNAATTPLGTGPHPFGNANGLAYDSRRHWPRSRARMTLKASATTRRRIRCSGWRTLRIGSCRSIP
jgi:DNA-binding beta-propeller fold protein YncE